MKTRMLLIFLAIFLSASFSYAGSNLFYPYVTFPTGSSPEAVAIGDVNGDGRNDVVMTTSFYFDPGNDYHIFVFLQNPSGELNPPIKYPTHSSYSNRSESIDIGDVNHDGRADVVVGNSGNNIEIFLQNASGGLGPGVSYPTVNSTSVKIADLNNDGLLDVVGIGWGTDTVDVFLQNSGGTLNPPVTYSVTHEGYDEVDIGDVNNDGLTDIIVMGGQGYSSPNIGVLLQKQDGSFNPAIYYDLGGNELTQGVAVGDVNGDNLRDVVVTYGGNSPSSKIGVFLQNMTRTLDPAVSHDSYDCPEPVVIADINNDGKKDIVVAHGGWLALGVYLQGTNGSLSPEELYPLPYATHYNPQGLAVGDINGDGFDDVVLADYNHGLVVLYNINGPPIPNISVTPTSVNFGSVFLGDSASRNITIYNRGTGSLTISAIGITGPDAPAFSQTNDCSTIISGESCSITARFNATKEGEKHAALTITSNDPDSPVVQVIFFAYAGAPLFYPYVIFPVGSRPEAVAIGDVNGDGKNDVVMTTSYYFDPVNDFHLHVFLQNASGELDPPLKYLTNSSYSNGPNSIDIGDVNHDGRADVVVGNSGSNIEVFLQNASGGLNPGTSYPTVNSTSIKLADLNSDGLLDLVGIGGGGTNNVHIFFQNANGTFSEPVAYSIIHSGEVDVGDVNNDGLTDITVKRGQGFNIGVLLQNSDGTFGSPMYYVLNKDQSSEGVAVGDLNADGLNDIVVTYGGNWPSSKIGVFLQDATGTLQPTGSYDSYDIPEPVVIADVNHDGRQDVILAHGGWQALGIYLQGTNGFLLPEELYPLPYASHYNPQGLAVGDINGDGFNDAVIADYNYGLVVVYNINGPPIPNISVTPTSVNFGSVFVGNSSSEDIQIYNRGTGPLTIRAIEITGPDALAFSQTNTCSTVGPGRTCAVTVRFNATMAGERNATLTITSNDPDTPVVQVTLFAYAAQPLFYPYVNFPVGSWPEVVAIGDVNGDGRNDVVMTTSFYFDPENDYHIFVFLQNSSGKLGPPIKYPTQSSYTNRSESIDIGDVNHDGRADVVVGNSGNNIEIFLQNASGGLDPSVSYPTVNSRSIKIGDLNNDGLLDVVGVGSGTSIHVFLQNVNGTLNPPISYSIVDSTYLEVDVGDINNDGLTDIIVMSGQGFSPNIGVLLQRSDGSFDPVVSYDLGGSELTSGVAIGDVNGDNLSDIVVTYGGNWPSSKIGVFLQNTAGTLEPAVSYDSYDCPEPVVIADVNNDGQQDVISAHGGWQALGVYLQGTNGYLLPEELYFLPYATRYNPQGLAVGDISDDGLNDVVIADYNYGLVVLYNLYGEETISPPTAPIGPNTVFTNVSQAYSTSGSASDKGHPIQYFFDWGDGTNSGWLPTGTSNASKSWTSVGTYKIKVQARCADHMAIVSPWSQTFSVTITNYSVVSPNGGETWTAGSTQTIRWIYGNNPGSFVKIELLKGGAMNRTIKSLISKGSGGNGSFNWKIPLDVAPGSDYKIRVTGTSNSSYTDTSDNNFTIIGAPPPAITVVSPNGGEAWRVGTTQTIRWTYVGSPGTSLKIELLKGGGFNRTITSFASTSKGSHSWRIPATQAVGNDFRIRITSRTDSSYMDTSDLDFTISK